MTMPGSGHDTSAAPRWHRTASTPSLVRCRRRRFRARLLASALNTTCLALDEARRIVLSGATAILALCSVALGTYAGFSAQVTAPGNTFATGTLQMSQSFGAANGGSGSFTFGTVSDLLPGEAVYKYIDLTNDGSLAFDLSLDPSLTSGSTALDNDADTTKRLQLAVRRCPGVWTSSGTSASLSRFSCSLATELLYSGQIMPGSTLPLTAGSSGGPVNAGSVARLELEVTLPSTATGTAGLSSTFQFTWTATNR